MSPMYDFLSGTIRKFYKHHHLFVRNPMKDAVFFYVVVVVADETGKMILRYTIEIQFYDNVAVAKSILQDVEHKNIIITDRWSNNNNNNNSNTRYTHKKTLFLKCLFVELIERVA